MISNSCFLIIPIRYPILSSSLLLLIVEGTSSSETPEKATKKTPMSSSSETASVVEVIVVVEVVVVETSSTGGGVGSVEAKAKTINGDRARRDFISSESFYLLKVENAFGKEIGHLSEILHKSVRICVCSRNTDKSSRLPPTVFQLQTFEVVRIRLCKTSGNFTLSGRFSQNRNKSDFSCLQKNDQ